jgi:hypothetical protein
MVSVQVVRAWLARLRERLRVRPTGWADVRRGCGRESFAREGAGPAHGWIGRSVGDRTSCPRDRRCTIAFAARMRASEAQCVVGAAQLRYRPSTPRSGVPVGAMPPRRAWTAPGFRRPARTVRRLDARGAAARIPPRGSKTDLLRQESRSTREPPAGALAGARHDICGGGLDRLDSGAHGAPVPAEGSDA